MCVYKTLRITIGSSLRKCTVNRDQCCHQLILDVVDHTLYAAVNNDTIVSGFTADVFTAAQNAIDEMRDKTNGMKMLIS